MQETFSHWTLTCLSPLSNLLFWTIALALLIACGLVLWSYWHAPKRRGWLIALRLLAALAMLALLSEPALEVRHLQQATQRIAVVVDRSRSMSLALPTGTSRYAALRAALAANQPTWTRLGQSHVIDWFDLHGALTAEALTDAPTGEETNLLAGLQHAHASATGKPLAGIVLISDGADNSGLSGANPGELSGSAHATLAALGVPVTTVDVTAGQTSRDVALLSCQADEFAFVHNTFEIECTVLATGFAALTLPVTVEQEGHPLATQEVHLTEAQPQRIIFKIKPAAMGEVIYTVSVPHFPGEALHDNNSRSLALSVIRDKIRVLHVAGRPSWDERFLRQHLKENPNVDLVSFFILRTPSDDAAVPESELSLIPFPVNKLFTTELSSFDVVILQNFDYRPFPMARYLGNIRDAVQAGLGLVMIGGDQSFANGGYQDTPVDEVLPVRLGAGALANGSFALELTRAGSNHPITQLGRDLDNNAALWKQLPALAGRNVWAGIKEQATALVVARAASQQTPAPTPQPVLMAAMEAGRGRSLAIATDSLWRWRFAAPAAGGAAPRAYQRFWMNALHWLVRDPKHARVRVVPSKRRYDTDDAVQVRLTVLDPNYQPLSSAAVHVELAAQGKIVRTDDLITDASGTAQLLYGPLERGGYQTSARASLAASPSSALGVGDAVFVVDTQSQELASSAPRPDLLAAIARATGGKALNLSDHFASDLSLAPPHMVEMEGRRQLPLWDNAWSLTLVVVLLSLDWIVRRRSGYV